MIVGVFDLPLEAVRTCWNETGATEANLWMAAGCHATACSCAPNCLYYELLKRSDLIAASVLQLENSTLQKEEKPMRYFEDFQVGERIELGSVTVTEEEIIAFARQYDPQPFHISPEQAKHSYYGGLIASGWHTVSLLMRLMVDALINDTISLGSPGVDEVRWLKPVRPNDTLHASFTVVETAPSKRRAELGILTSRSEVFNQSGELVLTLKGVHFFGRRPIQQVRTNDGAEAE